MRAAKVSIKIFETFVRRSSNLNRLSIFVANMCPDRAVSPDSGENRGETIETIATIVHSFRSPKQH